MNLIADKFLIRDVGTSGSTEFDLSNDELCEQMEHVMDGNRVGLIHTHHGLAGGAYFSGVDNAELQANTQNHEVYVSLVV